MSDVLSSLGLSHEEAEIYRVLLVSGQLSGGEIRSITGFGSSAVNDALQTLETKKLVRRVPGLQDRFAALLPVDTAIEKVQGSLGTISTLGREFQEEKERTLDEIKKESEKLLSGLEGTLETVRHEISVKSDETAKGINENAQTAMQALNSNKDQYLDEIGQNKTDLDRRATELIQHFTNRLDSAKTTLDTKISESLRTFLESTQITPPQISVDLETVEATANSIKERLEILRESERGLIGRQSNVNKSQIDNMKGMAEENYEKLIQLSQKHHGEFMDRTAGIKEKIDTSLDQAKKTLDDASSGLETSSSEVAESLGQGLDMLSSSKESLQQKLDEGTIGLQNALSTAIQAGKDQMSTIHSSGTTFVENTSQSVLEHFSLLENDFNSIIKQKEVELKQSMEQEFARLLQQAQETIETLNTTLSETLKQKLDIARNKQGELQSQAIETINQLNAQKNQELDSLQQQQIQNLEGIKTNLAAQMEQAFGNINAQVTGLQQKISELLSSTKNHISQSTDSLAENRIQIDQSIEQFLQNLNATLQAFHESLQGEKEAFVNQLTEQGTQIDAQLNSILTDIEQDIGHSLEDVDSSFSMLKNQISTKVAETNSSLNDKVIQITESLSSHLENLKNEFEGITETETLAQKNLVEAFKSDLDGFSQRLKALSTTLAEEMATGTSQLTDLLISKLNEHNEQIKENGFATVDKVKDVATGVSTAHLERSRALLDQYVGNFISNSDMLVSSLQGLNESLMGFSKLIDTTETPQIKTTTVVGKQAIIEYINDMLGRIKSKATILVPSVDMVNEQRILQLPRTVQVTIVSYIDEITHKDWIEKMHNAPANVTLRAIQRGGLGGTLPDFIGCEREGEEILLGTIDEGNNDYVAIASGSEYFVKILGNIVISDYARGKSRQLPK